MSNQTSQPEWTTSDKNTVEKSMCATQESLKNVSVVLYIIQDYVLGKSDTKEEESNPLSGPNLSSRIQNFQSRLDTITDRLHAISNALNCASTS